MRVCGIAAGKRILPLHIESDIIKSGQGWASEGFEPLVIIKNFHLVDSNTGRVLRTMWERDAVELGLIEVGKMNEEQDVVGKVIAHWVPVILRYDKEAE